MPEIRTTSSTGGQKGVKIERYDLIPVGPLRALAVHFGKGARKYDDGQWRKGYEWSKTISALMRHLEAFREGLDYDVCSNDPDGCQYVDNDGEPYEIIEPDTCYNHTGSHHLDAVMWHSFVLREFVATHPEHDDRYKPPVPEPVMRTWFLPSVEMTFQDVTEDQLAILTGRVLTVEDHEQVARFSMSVSSGETEDWDPLGFINEAFQTRD